MHDLDDDDLGLADEDAIPEIHTDHRVTRIPVLDPSGQGFGQIEVTLEPGQREIVELEHGRPCLVIRDYVH